MTDSVMLTTSEFELLQTALDLMVRGIQKEAGKPSPNQVVEALVEADGDQEKTKAILEAKMQDEVAAAKVKQREIAQLKAKLYDLEAEGDKSIAEAAAEILKNGDGD